MMTQAEGDQYQLKGFNKIPPAPIGGQVQTDYSKASDNYDQSSTINNKRPSGSFHHFRYVIIIMGGLAMGTMLFLRLTITVAMISMVNHTALYLKEHPNASEDALNEFFSEDYIEAGVFDWTNEIQQTIMSGYMITYTIPQFFTTRLIMRHGLRLGIAASLAICSISVILIPVMSHWGWQFALGLRFLNGLGGSAVLPSMVNAIECWLPYRDSAKGVVLFQFMSYSIFAFTPLISGVLASFHWQWAFYIPGIFGLMFALLWWILAADNPSASHYLSQKELDYINGVHFDDKSGKMVGNPKAKQRCDLPWYFVFKIKQFYTLTIIWCLFCSTVGGFLFLLPQYLKRILKVPVGEVGIISFYVQMATIFCMLWPHPLVNFLKQRFGISLSVARSIIVFICDLFVCCTFSYLAFFHDNLVITICINRFFHMTNDPLFMATVMSMFGHTGVSGLVYSMINTIGNLTTVFFCWAVGRFLDYTGETLECWSWVLTTMVLMNILYFLIYSAFCPSKPIRVKLPPEKDNLSERNPNIAQKA